MEVGFPFSQLYPLFKRSIKTVDVESHLALLKREEECYGELAEKLALEAELKRAEAGLEELADEVMIVD